MAFYADLHIHSKYSRACSKDCDLEHLSWWAQRKGVSLVGTGDFTHPAWHDHLRETLVPAEPGLYRLNPELEQDVERRVPTACRRPVRFMLSVEISTIYKRDGRTRKVHHLIYLPDLDAVARFNTALGRIGNLGADGRPILGLDSRDLLEIVLESSEDGYLVPAHIWTPWVSVLGSKSGFDAVADCYADLADHIFAVETGLSSDPAMIWRVSSLDRYRLVSNSDAHSPPALAREATVFDREVDYYSLRHALQTGEGFGGSIEFFPEEGKYHLDGHRKCDVVLEPPDSKRLDKNCPTCGKPLTIGVLHRVDDLADRPEGIRPPGAAPYTNLVSLPEIVGEINRVGPRSKTVHNKITDLVDRLGPELEILTTVPTDEVARVGGTVLGEALARLRRGEVIRHAGYDGEYGVIRVFQPDELQRGSVVSTTGSGGSGGDGALFDVPARAPKPRKAARKPAALSEPRPAAVPRPRPAPEALPEPAPPVPPLPEPEPPEAPVLVGMEEVGSGLLDRLDAMQRVAASAPGGPLLIVAGPGTGKTRVLTTRIAYLIAELGVPPGQCLAITFTRRAAEEMRERLAGLLGEVAEQITVTTFHGLGLSLLREHPEPAGLPPDFKIAEPEQQLVAMTEAVGNERDARKRLKELPELRRSALATYEEPEDLNLALLERYTKGLRQEELADLDELVTVPVSMLDTDPVLTDRLHARWPWVFVDEYQDVDEAQYRLLRLLCPPEGNLCAIGDPDQSIYRFRGADVGFFLRFSDDYPDARTVRLSRNYRSTAPILAAAVQAVAESSLVRGRILEPARRDAAPALIGRYAAASVADEADFVARTIDGLVGGVSHHSLNTDRVDSRAAAPTGVSFSDIAVLYRTDAQAKPIVDALSRSGIPVQKRSHDRLTDRPGVTEITRELKFLEDAGTVAQRLRVAARNLAGRLTETDPADLSLAVEVLTPLATRCGEDLEQFLTELAIGAEVDALDSRADRVTLLTLHASKGLEFPAVFLVGCSDALLPYRFPGSDPDPEQIAEERRLFFVGVTRAQVQLYLSHAPQGRSTTRPSRFLDAIDPGLFEQLNGTVPLRRSRDRQLRLL
ncbi:MAG TPA: UvrD-helicase domain-containing protein [Micromonosporaceae bacterium]|nr:UvrD-helicase domain-containing protein [Micromonosporaceae bacterium]